MTDEANDSDEVGPVPFTLNPDIAIVDIVLSLVNSRETSSKKFVK